MSGIIRSLGEMTPAWLEGRLRREGVLKAGAVQAVRQVSTAQTNVSTTYRLAVTYAPGAPADAPQRLFLKISNPGYAWPQEAQFYNEVVPAMRQAQRDSDWPFVRCFDAAYSQELQATHLLLEDLSATHRTNDGPMPPDEGACRQVVLAYARLHAFWWEHPSLGRGIGTLLTDEKIDGFIAMVQGRMGRLVEDLGEGLPADERAILERVSSRWPARRRERVTSGRGITVVHRDPHPLNYLYPRDPERSGVKLIDWQSWRVDTATDDLAYLMACHWPLGAQRQIEEDLVRRYHRRLLDLGVQGYAWEDCRYDYQASVIRCLFLLVLAWSPAHWARLQRGMQAYRYWGCAELLA